MIITMRLIQLQIIVRRVTIPMRCRPRSTINRGIAMHNANMKGEEAPTKNMMMKKAKKKTKNKGKDE